MNDYPRILKEFLSYMKTIKGASDLTAKEYGYDISTYLKFIKVIMNNEIPNEENLSKTTFKSSDISLLESVSVHDLYSYLSYLDSTCNNNARTRSRKISSIRTFYDYLFNKTNQISSNPALKLETPRISHTEPVYLTLSEASNLLSVILEEKNDFIRTRDYAMVTLFLNLGLRLGELRAINIEHIKDGKLVIHGKGNKERTVFLNDSCTYAINSYIVIRPKIENETALFLSERNQRISTRAIQYRIEKYLDKIGLDTNVYSVHKLRHTAATLMYRYGQTDIRTLQCILGHESVSTTQIYTHVDNEIVEKALFKNPLNKSHHTDE